MMYLMTLLNGIAVTFFGSILAFCFCGGFSSRLWRFAFCGYIAAVLVANGCVCYFWNIEFLRLIYPLLTHIPLMLLLWALSKKFLWSLFSVFFAYLCCQLKRWIALLIVALISGDGMTLCIVQLILTVPLFLLLLRLVVPTVNKLSESSVKLQLAFAVIPTLYYAFDYICVVYTDFLHSGNPVVVEFMPFVCCLAYVFFLLDYSVQEKKRLQLLQSEKILSIQISQSVREINALRESQTLARQYRHDLRHHLQYILSCIENGRNEIARDYIAGICKEIEAQKVQSYCENEAVNLILSAFYGRAKKLDIDMIILGSLPSNIKISDNDLCVLFSNALENALNACAQLISKEKECTIDVQFYYNHDKLFLQVMNSCDESKIRFEKSVPMSIRPNHGIGVQSICAIVEKYDGLHSFSVVDGKFVFRVSL